MSSSNKSSKHSSSPSSTPSTPHSSKLPKFLQKQRDRSKSVVEPSHSAGSSSSSISELPRPQSSTRSSLIRKSSRKSGPTSPRESVDKRQDIPPSDSPGVEQVAAEPQPSQDGGEETPVIVEPIAIPRTRTRSDRPVSENYPPVSYYPSSSNARLSDLPSRLSGWFSHTFSSSSNDLSLPQLLSQQHISAPNSSPKGKGSALLTAAKHGKGHLDKAMRYLLDSDAVPDKCTESIWLLGFEHPGYEPGASPPSSIGRRGSVGSRHSPSSHTPLSSSPTSAVLGMDPPLSQSQPASSSPSKDPGRHWPPVFYADFTSRIWLTYRSQFLPIRDMSLEELNAAPESAALSTGSQAKKWSWSLSGDKCWSSDAGWGCMLRTGQSLLANALIHVHLGRDWRKPPHPVPTSDYATYIQIITWFFDDPSLLCPFSVHRMALVGKQLGVKVGQWFGPSTAAGAIKTLVHAFPEAGLGIYVAADGGTIYDSEVFAASHSGIGSPRRHTRRVWGDRPVLILIGHRLGIDGVNPIYYDTLKTLYTWPQSVGIAGGRPSSSYYFVGSQADNLFYLDPHHARPTIPLRPPPAAEQSSPLISPSASRHSSTSPEPQSPSDRGSPRSPAKHIRTPTSPVSVRSGSSFSRITPPSPLQHQISTSSSATTASYVTTTSQTHSSGSHARWGTSSAVPDDSEMDSRELGIEGEDLDPVQRHYCMAYSATELKTFHCDRVRKMPLSSLDPSMLIGFLCKDESEWQDLKSRINELSRKSKSPVFHLQDEPPNWNSDMEMGLESISEPDIDLPDEDDEFADADDRMRESSASPDTSLPSTSSKKSVEEDDTEDDPVDPITPGPGRSAFSDIRAPGHLEKQPSTSTTASSRADSLSFDDEDDEEWEAPEVTPHPDHSPSSSLRDPPELLDSQATITRETSESSASDSGRAHRKKAKKKHAKPKIEQYPFPATYHDASEEPVAPIERRIPQMRTQKARDGGRTQSGGVRGIPADDLDDS